MCSLMWTLSQIDTSFNQGHTSRGWNSYYLLLLCKAHVSRHKAHINFFSFFFLLLVWLPDMMSYLCPLVVVSFSEWTGTAYLKETWPCLYTQYHLQMTWKMQEVNKHNMSNLDSFDNLFLCMCEFISIHCKKETNCRSQLKHLIVINNINTTGSCVISY